MQTLLKEGVSDQTTPQKAERSVKHKTKHGHFCIYLHDTYCCKYTWYCRIIRLKRSGGGSGVRRSKSFFKYFFRGRKHTRTKAKTFQSWRQKLMTKRVLLGTGQMNSNYCIAFVFYSHNKISLQICKK